MLSKITPRQEQVLQLLMLGFSNEEIAKWLNLSAATVQWHLGNLCRRAGVRGRVKLMMFVKQRTGHSLGSAAVARLSESHRFRS
jgi:DNA-binding NarL/FixJ family response regulator